MGATVIDERGTKDSTETMDVSQDDVLAYPAQVHQAYPPTVGAAMDSTVRPFVRKSMDVSFHILSVMDDKLGLPRGTLAGLSRPEERSGSTVRLIRAPPATSPSGQTFVSPHTDFGSLVGVFGLWALLDFEYQFLRLSCIIGWVGCRYWYPG